ncbi:hypothetical protein [Rhodoblastus sp.]
MLSAAWAGRPSRPVVRSALTFDYQFIGSPAYNYERGPANILSARYHAQF